ncbi:MAG: hypothetical protein KY432_11725 [Acidobacteria bacterium]|nr:hypothetical protein [Acidobacteriota bacterium]
MRNQKMEEIAKLEETIRKLKTMYDQFFAGTRPLPPSEERKRVERAIRELGQERIRDNATRFRFNNLLNRWTMFLELWNRKTREKEEGPLRYRERMAAFEQAGEILRQNAESSERPVPERVTSDDGQSYLKVTDSSNGGEIQALHEEIVRASTAAGAKAASLGQVSTMIESQLEKLKERYGTSSIGFRVEVVEGKVKLKAKPLGGSSGR